MNKTNLLLLADYLESLPEGYEHFNMSYFNADANQYPFRVIENHCGSVACAIGHAVYVEGLPKPHEYESWPEYSHRIFGIYEEDWSWCFSDYWEQTDNTPHGAAKRIRYMIEHGVPNDCYEQMHGNALLCY